MLIYLLKSGVCLVVFYSFYKLLLEKESIHTFKRYYLLISTILAFTIPLITFTQYTEVIPQIIPEFTQEYSNGIYKTIEPQQTNYISVILWSIYSLGALLFSLKFVKNLFEITHKIKRNPKHKIKNFTNVLLKDSIIPHTFFSYIFLNKHKFETHQIPKEVLLHEETHALQKHSLDVLFIEIFQIIFWFNPFIYFIKHSIKLNHEFLADQAVLNKGVTPSTYQQILLAFSSPDSYRDARTHQLANAINYSSIKKRFTVMKTQTSKKAFWLRGLIILPVLGILIYSFSEKKIIEKEAYQPYIIQQTNTDIGATEAMMKEYKSIINNFEATKVIMAHKLNRAKAIYDIMMETQRSTVKKYPDIPPFNLATVKLKTPSATTFNSWKNKEKFAIWINRKNVSNETLNNYKPSDIVYYSISNVSNIAQSKRHPQIYQNNLFTKEGFEENYLKTNINAYNILKNEYLKVKKEYINSDKKDNSELRILKAQLDKSYNFLSKEEIKKYDVKKAKPYLNLNTPQPTKSKDSLIFNIITVPHGKEFQLTLSDGTKIILKSNSKLKYPVKFIKGQPRKVELVGEAFFEVASNKEYNSPFIVITDDKEIDLSGKKLIGKEN